MIPTADDFRNMIDWESGECIPCQKNRLARSGLWVEGAWMHEDDGPDCFEQAGFSCIVHRGGKGCWCGYVGVPPGHPWHGKSVGDEALRGVPVHGGITWADTGHQHIQVADRPDLWWIGFDFGHGGDVTPDFVPMMGRLFPDDHYWTWKEAVAETWCLARYAEMAAREVSP